MARKKRPYIPKVKGCYQCSQRRIDCDGAKPCCAKCTARGLPCSGYGIKYRFRDGLAGSAGKAAVAATAARKTEFAFVNSSESSFHHHQPAPSVSIANATDGGDSDKSEGSPQEMMAQEARAGGHDDDFGLIDIDSDIADLVINPSLMYSSIVPGVDDFFGEADFDFGGGSNGVLDLINGLGIMLSSGTTDTDASNKTVHRHGLAEPTMAPETIAKSTSSSSTEEELSSHEIALQRLRPLTEISNVDPWKEFLLTYFSDHIAPEMVVVDDLHNGWRHLVLPIAASDELIMSTVLAVSAYHFTGKIAAGRRVVDPAALWGQAIRQLQRRRELGECDAQTKRFVVLAILVLLVAVMVNGCSDFPIVFHMLQAAIDAVGGEDGLRAEGGEVAEFALRQIRKMRVYAAPLLSQDAGVQAILAHSVDSFDCLTYYGRLHPNHQETFAVIASLRQQAYAIYLNRVLGNNVPSSHSDDDNDAVETFVRTIRSFPEGVPGLHCLVWPVFIAASEARTPEHRDFFWEFLEGQHRRNGFVNIRRALDLLQRIWGGDSSEDWSALLPEPQVFIM